jgi:hypothetical protein
MVTELFASSPIEYSSIQETYNVTAIDIENKRFLLLQCYKKVGETYTPFTADEMEYSFVNFNLRAIIRSGQLSNGDQFVMKIER